MVNINYPELMCKGYERDNCMGVVVSKKYSLCNNCYSRYYWHELMHPADKQMRITMNNTKKAIKAKKLKLMRTNNSKEESKGVSDLSMHATEVESTSSVLNAC